MYGVQSNLLLTAATSAVAGVCAWIITNFLADPLLEFRRQRKAIHQSLFFTANISSGSKEDDISKAETELRRHAAALNALWATSPWIVKRWFRLCGYNVENAASRLTGFSNSLRLEEGSKAIHRHGIEKGLRFTPSYTDEDIKGIVKENRERARRS